MNQRFLIVLSFAFVVASGAAVLLYRMMAAKATVQPGPQTVKVVMASRDLPIGTLMKEADLKMGDWAGALPEGATSKFEDLVGRGVVSTLYAGEPVLINRLAPKGAGAGLASMIPNGMRAVALRINDVSGVGGFAVAGMRVDVLISGQAPGVSAEEGSRTKTLLQNIEVLSAGTNFQKDAEGKPVSVPVVNVLVTPEQAEMLSLASAQTTVQLVLRNPLDTELAKPPGTAVAALFRGNGSAPPPARSAATASHVVVAPRVALPPPAPIAKAEPKEQPFVMEVLHGSRRAGAKFDGPGESQ